MTGAIDYPGGISAIDTDHVRPWLDASHLIVERGRAAFVDTGTSLVDKNNVDLYLASAAEGSK